MKYPAMEELSASTGINFNKLFCGYLRQPIDSYRDKDSLTVKGYCSFYNKKCERMFLYSDKEFVLYDMISTCD